MAAMKMDGVDAKSVNVMNMRPPEIAAAWERGDIDATFIWDPVLSKIKANGKVHRHLGQHRQAAARRPSKASWSTPSGPPPTSPSWSPS